MIRFDALSRILIKARTGSYVHLTTNYRLDSFFNARFVKIHGAVKDAVVSQGDSAVALGFRLFRNVDYPAGAVEEAVFTVKMKMSETVTHRSCALLSFWLFLLFPVFCQVGEVIRTLRPVVLFDAQVRQGTSENYPF